MLKVKSRFNTTIRALLLACTVVLSGTSASLAQGKDEPTAGELLKQAIRLMELKKYDDAILAMYQYLDVVGPSTAPRVVLIAQDIRFKLASMLIEQKRLEEAVEILQQYVDLPLGKYPRLARKMLSTSFYELKDFDSCVKATLGALEYNANPVVVAEKAIKGASDEDLPLSFEKEKPEPAYTEAELIMLYLALGEAYYGLNKWEECIEPFTYVIEHTPNELRKGYAIMQIVNALVKIPSFDRVTTWIPQLYRTTARYDIRVNLALMNAAAELYEAGEYDSALPLYRMILPREELIAYQKGRIREMRIAEGLPPEEGMQASEADLLVFGGAAAPEEKSKELLELEHLIKALKELPPYEVDIQYRMAQLYKDIDRYWEAVKFFEVVYDANPTNSVGDRSIYELVSTLLEDLKNPEQAERLAYAHIGKYKEGMTPRQIGYALTSYYQRNRIWPSIKKLSPYLDSFVRTNEQYVVQYDTELYYMQAVSDLMTANYDLSEVAFKRVLEEFPGSKQEGNSLYWYAMSKLFQQKYAEAFAEFENYAAKFPSDVWIDESYYQGGICLFGMEQYTNAMERFSIVIKNYPNSVVFPESCNMRGDLYGSWGMLDEAIVDYKMALAAATKPAQATYAVFQLAEVYEAEAEDVEGRYDLIVKTVQAYLDQWKDKADIAKALFWIGKTKIQQELYDEAVDTYLGAIIRFGKDVRQDGVDMMISELVKVSNVWLDTAGQTRLRNSLLKELEATDDLTLKLRLRVVQAKLDRAELELGKALLVELPNLDNASPPVLAAMCEASFENKDYSRSEELLRVFKFKFEDSDYMRAAFKLRGFGQYEKKEYDGALETVNEAQALYGTDSDVAWAQLLKAQVLLDKGDIDAARETNLNVLSVPTWRGEPVAQATYQLGQVEEKAGNARKAHGFYQRTYFAYKALGGGYWAAESYLGAARCLKMLAKELPQDAAKYEDDYRNTYQAMLFDTYVNKLPQAAIAREALGSGTADQIQSMVAAGVVSNISVSVEAEMIDTRPVIKREAKEAPAPDAVTSELTDLDAPKAQDAEGGAGAVEEGI